MVRKTLIIVAFTLLVLLIQILFGPWLSIRDIRPDFMLILALFVGRLQGKVAGQLFGFGSGLLVDGVGIGSFLGLSALAKTIAGFCAGLLRKKQRRWNPFLLYGSEVLIIIVHFTIIFLINFKNSDLSYQYIFLRYILPSSLYTIIFYYLIKHFAALELD